MGLRVQGLGLVAGNKGMYCIGITFPYSRLGIKVFGFW